MNVYWPKYNNKLNPYKIRTKVSLQATNTMSYKQLNPSPPNTKHDSKRPQLYVRTDSITTRDASDLALNSAANVADPYEFYRENTIKQWRKSEQRTKKYKN